MWFGVISSLSRWPNLLPSLLLFVQGTQRSFLLRPAPMIQIPTPAAMEIMYLSHHWRLSHQQVCAFWHGMWYTTPPLMMLICLVPSWQKPSDPASWLKKIWWTVSRFSSSRKVSSTRPLSKPSNLLICEFPSSVLPGFFFLMRLSYFCLSVNSYGVIIDGERGNRPHILPQEELLKEGVSSHHRQGFPSLVHCWWPVSAPFSQILDVTPSSRSQLVEGVRVCAYWSQKFTCLYPGTISKPSTPNPEDLISVEFDDGDSGSIALEHIRMLPQDFPVQEGIVSWLIILNSPFKCCLALGLSLSLKATSLGPVWIFINSTVVVMLHRCGDHSFGDGCTSQVTSYIWGCGVDLRLHPWPSPVSQWKLSPVRPEDHSATTLDLQSQADGELHGAGREEGEEARGETGALQVRKTVRETKAELDSQQ